MCGGDEFCSGNYHTILPSLFPGLDMDGSKSALMAGQRLSDLPLLEIDIVMSSSLFMLITYYSVMTDTYERD